MASSQSVVSICNRALLSIGARSFISNLNEGSKEANACSILFSPTYTALARSARWNCFRAQATLSLLKAAIGTPENPNGTLMLLPPTPWLYEYAAPSDSLAIRFIVPSCPAATVGIPPTSASIAAPIYIPGNGQIPFAVAYDTDSNNNPISVILTNQENAQVVYTVDQEDPSQWDSQFQAAMVAALAAYLVPALSLDLPLMQMSIKSAESIIMQARVADGNEGVTSMDHTPDWIRARAAGGGYYNWGYGMNGGTFGGYSNMCWPGC
jgi:hypothetical protein